MKMKKIRSARSKEKTEKRVSVNFTPTEYAHFLTMKEESGVPSLSLFIKARIFNETFRVIKVDRSLLDYYQKLTTLYGQFRSVGVNYNQTVVAIRRPLHGDWRIFCLLIHCIIGSYFVYLSIKNSIIFLPWHTNPRIPMSM